MEIGSEVLRGSEGNQAPKGDAEADSVMFGAGSDRDLSEAITEGWLAVTTIAEESSMDSSVAATSPVDDSRSGLLNKTRDWWLSGV